MHKYKKDDSQQILDVGCGLGGTAHYIQKQGWGRMTGFDIESESIQYAIKHYPEVTFYTSDVCQVNKLFIKNTFDIICAFNSFYGFRNQISALQSLNMIARTKAKLAIFDYSFTSSNKSNAFLRDTCNNQNPWKPVILDNIDATLRKTSWHLSDMIDMTDKYIGWYDSLVRKLEINRDYITCEFGRYSYIKALSTYSNICHALTGKRLGGVIVYAEKVDDSSFPG